MSGTSPTDSARARRRSPEEADQLRARMILEGYPLPDLTSRENEQFWWSLVGQRRRPHLLALVGMTDDELRTATDRVRRKRQAITGRR